MNSAFPDTSVYTDFTGLAGLKAQARQDSPEALREVAKQFEAIFIQMMLKSMREASLGDGLMDGPQMDNYMGMYDQQLSLSLAKGPGLGFSDLLVQQLGGGRKPQDGADATTPPISDVLERVRSLNQQPAVVAVPAAVTSAPERPLPVFETPADFVHSLLPEARNAAARLGTQPEVLIAQAALETGWGQSLTKRADGGSSYNLFNIKADARWGGDKVTVPTLEYRNGVAVREKASFRAYDSFADSFNDYVNFLQSSPRYRQALEQAHTPEQFVQELHKAGYASDPAYADKIGNILKGDVIGSLAPGLKISNDGPIT